MSSLLGPAAAGQRAGDFPVRGFPPRELRAAPSANPNRGVVLRHLALRRKLRTMCGRARLSSDVSEIKLVFSIPPSARRRISLRLGTWRRLTLCRLSAMIRRAGERSLDVMRWGLVPYWAKDIKIGYSTINAKAEGIDTRPAFREPFQRRRCLVPLDSFYEWKKLGKDRQPYAVALSDRRLMAMAGLWDSWRSPDGERVRSFTIVTTEPNELLAPLHDRMPVIFAPENWPLWLGELPADPDRLKALLVPYPANDLMYVAGRSTRRQCQKQRPVADRTARRAANADRGGSFGRQLTP